MPAEPSKELTSVIDDLGDKIKALESELADLKKLYAQMTKNPAAAKKSVKELIKVFGSIDKASGAASAAASKLPPVYKKLEKTADHDDDDDDDT